MSAGQKTGALHVLDAATGVLISTFQAVPPPFVCPPLPTPTPVPFPPEIGLFADSAVAAGVVFANGADCTLAGNVIAIKGDSSGELWRFVGSPFAPAVSGVAVANGVVYFQTIGPDPDLATVFGLDADSGKKLVEVHIHMPALSGPAVSHGRIYLGAGFFFPPFFPTPGGGLIAVGL